MNKFEKEDYGICLGDKCKECFDNGKAGWTF